MKKRRSVGSAVALILALVPTACSDDESTTGTETTVADHGSDLEETATEAPADAAGFNDADVSFAQAMIPHHEQALDMARLAETRAESDELKDLAAQIESAQAPEIEQLQGFLDAWGQDQPAGGLGGIAHDSGMMSEDDLTGLEEASGAEFERMFLLMMIEHHQGAIEMAQIEIGDGENAEAKELAQAIIDAQEAEILAMQGLLDAA
jgi:uncharacterized protein (DUF305 family)